MSEKFLNFDTGKEKLFEELSKLREAAHAQTERETTERIKNNPQPTEEEILTGAFREMIEPQVRDALFLMYQKGYSTASSGFGGEKSDIQQIDGYFEIDEETKEKMEKAGAEVLKGKDIDLPGFGDNYTFIRFYPKEAKMDKIKEKWDEIVSILPQKPETVLPSISGAGYDFRKQFAPDRIDIEKVALEKKLISADSSPDVEEEIKKRLAELAIASINELNILAKKAETTAPSEMSLIEKLNGSNEEIKNRTVEVDKKIELVKSETAKEIKATRERQGETDIATVIKNKLTQSIDFFINDNRDYSPDQKKQLLKRFEEALNLSLEIHKDQKPRPDGPYINHILRVGNRIIEEYGIKDPELVIAAVLHDSIEDQSEKLALLVDDKEELISTREKALLFIKNTFGEKVEKIVSKLSNPEPKSEGLSPDEKNFIYKEHVKEAIEDSDVFPIKLSDFSDNALNLEAIDDPVQRLKLSKKYLPIMEIFIDRIDRAQNILNPEKIVEMRSRLLSVIKRTKVFIQNQENI